MLTVDPYPYQDHAIDMGLDRGNLLIAYGMGLGKTLVQTAICEELVGDGKVQLSAIVVPASLKWQWAQALAWATDMPTREIRLKKQKVVVPEQEFCVVIDGTPEKRVEQFKFARKIRPDYVIMGYNNVINDWRYVNWLHPELIALDEATAIKTSTAERSKLIKDWWAPYRFALTGTPIDNRPEELFSIMEWVDPQALGKSAYFDKAYIRRDSYGRPKAYKNLDVLHNKIQTFVARKTRFDPDVAPFMPKDYHRQVEVDLASKTRSFYKEIAGELAESLESIVSYGSFDVAAYYAGERSTQGSAEQGQAMAKYGTLTMLCDHPMLLVESALKVQEYVESEDENPVMKGGSMYAYELYVDGRLDWITDKVKVPKFEETCDQIQDMLDERDENKIIVFSFSKGMLRLFQKRFGDTAVIFDGDMSASQKEAAKQRFKTSPDVRLFLSSDAGGMGVDLPEANYLINYNHPWSAGLADQRNSRHIRAGSKWDEVWVINMLVRGSVEEWKFSVLDIKRRVGSAIMDGALTNDGVIAFDVESLLSWLKTAKV